MSSLFSNPKKPATFSIRVEGMASDSCVQRAHNRSALKLTVTNR
jgi:cytochrome c-type biogenesis protein CcmE